MLKFKIVKFNWDKVNKEKCTKHGIDPNEIEEFFRSKEMFVSPDIKHSDSEDRYFAIGKMPNDRSAFVAFTYARGKNKTN